MNTAYLQTHFEQEEENNQWKLQVYLKLADGNLRDKRTNSKKKPCSFKNLFLSMF